jgi:DNA-directed RNA polymerase specialized sigma24 family protein
MTTTVKEGLRLVRDHGLGWGEFLRRTRPEWSAMAGYLYSRWQRKLPAGVTAEDVGQELMIGAWEKLLDWREDGGQPLHRWVTIGAMCRAKSWLHKQRAAKGGKFNQPSRHPVTFSSLVRAGDERAQDDEFCPAIEPDQEALVELKLRVERKLAEAASAREHYGLRAVVASWGDLDEAAELLFGDKRARRACRIEDHAEARRAIYRALGR